MNRTRPFYVVRASQVHTCQAGILLCRFSRRNPWNMTEYMDSVTQNQTAASSESAIISSEMHSPTSPSGLLNGRLKNGLNAYSEQEADTFRQCSGSAHIRTSGLIVSTGTDS